MVSNIILLTITIYEQVYDNLIDRSAAPLMGL